MTKNPLARKILVTVAIALVGFLALGAVLVTISVRRPLPDHADATVGVGAEVSIYRDDLGIPHIYASTDRDLMFAQGYVHAQDRFFEMDYRRHVTAGRLSELVGENEAALQADIAIRTMGWRHVAEQEWGILNREARELLTAYADGVNAYIEHREASELALEYLILGARVAVSDPEPWTPLDSLTWLKAMSWDLRANYDEELGRATVYKAVGQVDLVDDIYPPYPYTRHAPIILGASSPGAASDPEGPVTNASWEEGLRSGAVESAVAALEAVPVLLGRGPGVGSNAFVVSGEHTESGLPLLANDPHLELGMPGIWYQVGLHCTAPTPECTFDVAGFSFSGMPGVIIGHNAELAWGLTNLGADVTDFFLERVYDDGTYDYGDQRLRLTTREEVIEVNGGEPVTIAVRSTVHGPLITGMLPAPVASAPVPPGPPPGTRDGFEIALRWTALDPGTSMEAIFDMDRASTPRDVSAVARLLEVPAQAIIFATRAGDIGFYAPGRIPVRGEVAGPVPSDGTWPRPGWDPEYDWKGYLSAGQMPRKVNPEEGFIVSANQAVTVPEEGPHLAADFDPGYRAQRVRALLNGMFDRGERLSVDMANRIMLDSRNPAAEMLVPIILRLQVEDPFVAVAIEELAEWRNAGYPNGEDSAGAAYFNLTWAYLLQGTFGDEFGPEENFRGARWTEVVRNQLASPKDWWWDDVTTAAVTETRDEILLQALTNARAQLTRIQAKDPSSWSWGALHTAAFTHPLFNPETVPGVISRIFNPAPVPISGGTASVNATDWDVVFDERGRPDFRMVSGPSMRMVVDLADLDGATWVVTSGVSGHQMSGDYANQLDAWRAGGTFQWPWSKQAVEEGARSTMRLLPGG